MVVLGILLVFYFSLSNGIEKRYQWTENYKNSNNQPYGTSFIQQLLASYRPGHQFILNEKEPLAKILDTAQVKPGTDYIFIGQDIYLDEADRNALINFVQSGNDAFISTVNLPFDVLDLIFVSECDQAIFLSAKDTLSVAMNFYNNKLKSAKGYRYAYRFGKKDVPYYWNSLTPEIFCDSTKSIVPLGYIDPDKVNFVRLPYGKGNFYLHTNPIVFTNYFIAREEKAAYAAGVFSYLHGGDIIWDEFSKAKFLRQNNAPEISPISYILQHDSLRYAWWLMLASAVLYTIFTAKRKQRVIPVFEEKANTSLEFVNLISALHFQNGNHHDIARKKMKYFLYFIRAKYGLHLQSFGEIQIKRLAEKSKVDIADLQIIFTEFHHIEHQPFYNEHRLVDLYNALEKFYKICK